ncbi:MAG: hypothetical protein HYY18_20065 [Planctomycetes bacterium]|nr:hypothetical protein [Planctomycetota bacterium]
MAGSVKPAAGPRRVSVQEVRKRLISGAKKTVLVCIYDQDDWDESHLDGSISMPEFEKRAPRIEKDTEVVFY